VEPPPLVSEPDRELLLQYLDSLHDLLDHLARQPRLTSPETAALLARAWEEIEREERFGTVRSMIESRDFDGGLIDHGLYGQQLAFKVFAFEHARDRLEQAEHARFRRKKQVKGVAGWVLKVADVALDSIAGVFPPAGAIQEFKNGAEAALDEPSVSFMTKAGRKIARLLRGPRDEPEPEPEGVPA
jgi:hypothetical protein